MIVPKLWHGRRVFITGHTGFKGSWLSQWLLEMGATVKGYSLDPPTDPSLFKLLGLEKHLDHVLGDIRDGERLAEEMNTFQPEFVFHLAAQPIVRLSYKEPKLTYETNVIGTLNLYEAVRKCESVYVVVSVTTDKCYENKEWVWGYRESDPMGGYDPYSSSKGCAELLSAAYRNSYFNPNEYGTKHHVVLATARAGNVIGGGDWGFDRLIPDCVRALSKGKAIKLRNPKSIRPWQHVIEPLSGYLVLSQRMKIDGVKFSGGWNFGPNDVACLSVEDVVRTIIEFWGSGCYQTYKDAEPHEAQILKLDISKASSYLNWSPVFNPELAIQKTIEFYKTYYNGSGVKGIVCRQINNWGLKKKNSK